MLPKHDVLNIIHTTYDKYARDKKVFFNYFRTRGNVLKRSLSPPFEESANMWDTLETDNPDVIEYLKSIESNKSKL